MKAFLPEQTRISQVHLRTARLKDELAFYTEVLGLKLPHAGGPEAALSASPEGPALLILSEDLNAPRRPPHSTGLYHFALRYPARENLAQAYRRLLKNGYPIAGAADHGVSEAVYLSDPEGNGVELYADRPRSEWPWHDGEIAMVTKELDLGDLRATPGAAATFDLSAGVEIGHIHLNVADLAAAERFYSEFLGFAVTQRSYPGALFFAADGYHHHIGVNVWAGKAAPPANSCGLVSYRFEVPITEILYCLGHRAPLLGFETRQGPQDEVGPILQIRDPSGSWLEVRSSTGEPLVRNAQPRKRKLAQCGPTV